MGDTNRKPYFMGYCMAQDDRRWSSPVQTLPTRIAAIAIMGLRWTPLCMPCSSFHALDALLIHYNCRPAIMRGRWHVIVQQHMINKCQDAARRPLQLLLVRESPLTLTLLIGGRSASEIRIQLIMHASRALQTTAQALRCMRSDRDMRANAHAKVPALLGDKLLIAAALVQGGSKDDVQMVHARTRHLLGFEAIVVSSQPMQQPIAQAFSTVPHIYINKRLAICRQAGSQRLIHCACACHMYQIDADQADCDFFLGLITQRMCTFPGHASNPADYYQNAVWLCNIP